MTDTTTIPTAESWDPDACAARGAALLDQQWPGWRDQIDRDRLNMADGTYQGRPECRACIGAQLDYHRLTGRDFEVPAGEAEGDYFAFLERFIPFEGTDWRARRAFAVEHGFEVPGDAATIEAAEGQWERLTAAWRTLLAAPRP